VKVRLKPDTTDAKAVLSAPAVSTTTTIKTSCMAAGHTDLSTTQRYMHFSPAATEGAIGERVAAADYLTKPVALPELLARRGISHADERWSSRMARRSAS